MILRTTIVICLVLSVLSLPRGAIPSQSYPTTGLFQCEGGAFPIEKINDDYCDCLDGYDEPGTSACSTLGKFHCPNLGHEEKIIRSSQVNDLVCDCCDGSDEYDTGSSCSNTCNGLAERLRIENEKKEKERQEGLKAKEQLLIEANEKLSEKKNELETLKAQKTELEHELSKLNEKVTEEEEIEKKEAEEDERARANALGDGPRSQFGNSFFHEDFKDGGVRWIINDLAGVEADSNDNVLNIHKCDEPIYSPSLTIGAHRPNISFWYKNPYSGSSLAIGTECMDVSNSGIDWLVGGTPSEGFVLRKDNNWNRLSTLTSSKPCDNLRLVLQNKANSPGECQNVFVDSLEVHLEPSKELAFSSYRFRVTKTRSSSSIVQASEVKLLFNSKKLSVIKATNPTGTNPEKEGPEQVVDDNPKTKWLQWGFSNYADLIIDLSTASFVNQVELITANDSPERDPVSFVLSGRSRDDDEWTTVMIADDANVPNERETSVVVPLSLAYHIEQPKVVVEKYTRPQANEARTQRDLKQNEVNSASTKIQDLEKELTYDYGPNGEFYALKGKCYELNDGKYVYSLCPFDKVTQGHTNIGRYDKWSRQDAAYGAWAKTQSNEYNVQKYDRGDYCYSGPIRNTEVTFLCGPESKILTVDEPSMCTYTMKFQTPLSCQ